MRNAFTHLPIAIIMYRRIKTTKREQKDHNGRCFRTPTKNINLNSIFKYKKIHLDHSKLMSTSGRENIKDSMILSYNICLNYQHILTIYFQKNVILTIKELSYRLDTPHRVEFFRKRTSHIDVKLF